MVEAYLRVRLQQNWGDYLRMLFLSEQEINYLLNPQNFRENYGYQLKHRIKKRMNKLIKDFEVLTTASEDAIAKVQSEWRKSNLLSIPETMEQIFQILLAYQKKQAARMQEVQKKNDPPSSQVEQPA